MPDVVLIQLILLMMGTWLPVTCREYKQTYMKKNCASSWLFTKMEKLVSSQISHEGTEVVKISSSAVKICSSAVFLQ